MRKVIFPETISPTFVSFARSFEWHLYARNLSPKIVATYLDSLKQFGEFLQAMGMPQEIEYITREHIETFLQQQVATRKPNTAYTRQATRSVKVEIFVAWVGWFPFAQACLVCSSNATNGIDLPHKNLPWQMESVELAVF